MFYKWRQGRQRDERNPFLEWLQYILGITTTTPTPPLVPPDDCEECSCGKANGRRIVGGTETGINQYPWMAMLLYSNRFYCGAALINDRYVLERFISHQTASHCVHGFNPTRLSVRLLEHDRSISTESKTITRKVKRIVKHPRYSQSNYDNDIALVQLDEPVEFEGILNPVCLAKSGKTYSDSDGIVTGWGTLKEGGDVSNTLQEVVVPIMTNSECKATGYASSRITENMLCAGFEEGKKDSCQGDSGGPLHVFDSEKQIHEIVGVVSWGDGCAKKDYPGVYARVNRYLKWIKTNTIDACSCS
ncbi:CLUMA_CG018008, isoform A [Clunio marinus]|uniref:CLUMA_CG018008, isoform A n=1 Tax=Clunio marinus TaxID=568069 RepID=A0A1J1IYI4_9DIPT|nr:CLUMA_CG018008, isoform A [Clunio marinus]